MKIEIEKSEYDRLKSREEKLMAYYEWFVDKENDLVTVEDIVNKNIELEEENKKLKAELDKYKKQYEHSMGEDNGKGFRGRGIMQTLELVRIKTDVLTTCGDVIIRLADFIKDCFDNHNFMGIGMRDENGELRRHIYCDRAEIEERRYNDLVYESLGDYYTYSDYMDGHPELENKDEYIRLKHRLCDLRDKDLIPNVI